MKTNEKTVVVTGASPDIGAAYLAKGYRHGNSPIAANTRFDERNEESNVTLHHSYTN